jgi:hypothetical protein
MNYKSGVVKADANCVRFFVGYNIPHSTKEETSMSDQFSFGGDIVWRPTQAHIERAHLTTFMRQHRIENFEALMKRSTEDVE